MKNYLPLARVKNVRQDDSLGLLARLLTVSLSYSQGFFSSSPKAFIGDPLFPGKSLDSRSEALRE